MFQKPNNMAYPQQDKSPIKVPTLNFNQLQQDDEEITEGQFLEQMP